MKKALLMTTAIVLAMPVISSYAADTHHPGKQAQGQSMSTQPGGGMMQEKMQTQMKQMRQQMQEIRNTKDPDKREALIEEHMKSMHEGMKMMRDMGGQQQSGKMGMGMMGDKQQEGKMGMMGDDMGKHMDAMEQRMDMMETMMDQMLQNQMEMQNTRKQRD